MTATLAEICALYGPPIPSLVLGQSNGRSSSDSAGGRQSPHPKLFAWNQNSIDNNAMVAGTQWLPAEFGTPPFNIPAAGGGWANSIAFSRGRELIKRTGRPVCIVQIAAGSHHIESFIKAATRAANGWSVFGGNQDLTTFMYPGLLTALTAIPGSPTAFDEGSLIQGEANQIDQVEIGGAKIVAMWTDLANAGLIDLSNTPIAQSRLLDSVGNPYRNRHYYAMRWAQEKLPTMRIVPSAGLPPAVTGDVHYTGPGLVEMGRRFDTALANPPERIDFNVEPIRLDVDYGLLSFTTAAHNATPDLADRPAMPSDPALTIENNPTLGYCYRAAANVAVLFASRRLFPMPSTGVIVSAFEALTTSPGATIDMRLSIYQYDKDMALIGALNIIPANSVLTDAMGRTVYRGRFGRSAECDITVSASCEYFAYAMFCGQGNDDETFAFRMLEMGIAPLSMALLPAPSFTVAGAPSAAAYPRATIYVSNEVGGPVLAFSDGVNWRRVTDRAVIA